MSEEEASERGVTLPAAGKRCPGQNCPLVDYGCRSRHSSCFLVIIKKKKRSHEFLLVSEVNETARGHRQINILGRHSASIRLSERQYTELPCQNSPSARLCLMKENRTTLASRIAEANGCPIPPNGALNFRVQLVAGWQKRSLAD